jgi:hypothetical protein
MQETRLEDEKDALISILTDAYAKGSMDMAAFESSVTRISASADRLALQAEASALGLAMPRPVLDPSRAADLAPRGTAEELRCVSGSIRKEGDWIRSRRYRMELKSASARLDLRDYEGTKGFRLELELEAVSSTVKIIVPRGFEVEDRFADARSSTVRNKPRGEARCDSLILLTGALRSSTVKIRYR